MPAGPAAGAAGWSPDWPWGLGILAKGPVILVHVLPAALAAPYWAGPSRPSSWLAWYAGLAGAVVLGAALALAWALPAAMAGGEAYAGAILWDQTAGRASPIPFAHGGPWWFYLVAAPAAPAALDPVAAPVARPRAWPLWPSAAAASAWSGWSSPSPRYRSISGKQPHYLIPSLPAAALLFAAAIAGAGEMRRFDALPVAVPFVAAVVVLLVVAAVPPGTAVGLPPDWSLDLAPLAGLPAAAAAVFAVLFPRGGRFRRTALIAGAGVVLVIAAHLTAAPYLARAYDLGPVAQRVAELQRAGHAVANISKYHGQYHFLGRLEEPIRAIWEPRRRGLGGGAPGRQGDRLP